ncbi:MAG: hypothetical protein M3Z03_12210 [Actinomycetota bacterium]|nr:hypothetical protein [Actinomycetota bacterium]
MARYRLAGLVLDSAIDLPEVPLAPTHEHEGPEPGVDRWEVVPAGPSGAPRDEVVIEETELADGAPWSRTTRDGADYHIAFPELVAFHIDPVAHRVSVAVETADASTVRHLLLDQVVPRILSLGATIVLHASAVLLETGAVAFVGPSGAGKSTMAAAMVRNGGRLLSDDFVALDDAGHRFEARSTYPGLRLWKDSTTALAIHDDLTPMGIGSPKLRWRLPTDRWERRPAPLVAIVELGGSSPGPPSVERLHGHRAFMAVYPHCFRMERAGSQHLTDELDRFDRLMTNSRVARVARSHGYEAIDVLVDAVTELAAGAA